MVNSKTRLCLVRSFKISRPRSVQVTKVGIMVGQPWHFFYFLLYLTLKICLNVEGVDTVRGTDLKFCRISDARMT